MAIQLEAKTLDDRIRLTLISKHCSQKVLAFISRASQITASRPEERHG